MEDEEWLNRHPRYGIAGSPMEREKLGVDRLERMLGILERATGQADPVPMPQAETLFVSQLGMNKVPASVEKSFEFSLSLHRSMDGD